MASLASSDFSNRPESPATDELRRANYDGRFGLDRVENQASVNIARMPAASMTTNSIARIIGALRSSHSAIANEPAPRGGRSAPSAKTYGLTR